MYVCVIQEVPEALSRCGSSPFNTIIIITWVPKKGTIVLKCLGTKERDDRAKVQTLASVFTLPAEVCQNLTTLLLESSLQYPLYYATMSR